MLNYRESIKRTTEALSAYRPLVINGSVKSEKRNARRLAFQAASTEHRLLIANMALLENGVDLDDQDGRFPRAMLVSPSYHGITLQQINGRLHRIRTRSSSTIYYVAQQGMEEKSLYNNLKCKAAVLSETTGSNAFDLPSEVLHYSQL